MVEFHAAYRDVPKLQPLAATIGWSHNLVIFQQCKAPEERESYIRMTKKFGWSKNVLIHQMNGNWNVDNRCPSLHCALINVQRIRRILQVEGSAGLPVLAGIAGVVGCGAERLKWKGLAERVAPLHPSEALFFLPDYRPMPMVGEADERFARFGLLRDTVNRRGYSQSFRPNEQTTLALQLRALFGVNARSDILQYLFTHSAAHPAEIARQTYFFTKTVQDALVSMRHSGVVEVRNLGREKHYWVRTEDWAKLLNRTGEGKVPRWTTWPAVLGILERVWLKLQDPRLYSADALVVSTEFRQLFSLLLPAIERAGLPFNVLSQRQYVGEEFTDAFLADVNSLLE